jgi:hypothetical protein
MSAPKSSGQNPLHATVRSWHRPAVPAEAVRRSASGAFLPLADCRCERAMAVKGATRRRSRSSPSDLTYPLEDSNGMWRRSHSVKFVSVAVEKL